MNKFIKFKRINYKGLDVFVSKEGDIFANGKIKKHRLNKDGYPVVSLYLRKYTTRYVSVARLVALTYIPNPDNLPEVNHKDYNRKNFSIENLEWITHSDNVRYSVCNKPNVSGSNNPNYGNKKLSIKYKKDKILAKEKQSRPGLQNGRCRKIKMYKDNLLIQEFDYIKLCCQYFIDNKISSTQNTEIIRNQINRSIRNNKKYKGYSFIKE